MPFQGSPFNGDDLLCEEFLKLRDRYNIKTVIELGSAVGGTTAWLCENFRIVVTIEVNHIYRDISLKRISKYKNVLSLLGSSVDLLADVLSGVTNDTIIFIDSHWGANNPLLQELSIIKNSGIKPILVLHDFKNPGNTSLQFDVYPQENIIYEWDWIKGYIESIYGDEYTKYHNRLANGAMVGVIIIIPQDNN